MLSTHRLAVPWTLCLLLAVAFTTFADDAPTKLPLPSEADRESERARVRDVLADSYRSRDVETRTRLVEELLKLSDAPDTSPAMRYVMLIDAAEFAASVHRLDLVLNAYRKLNTQFDVNASEQQAAHCIDALDGVRDAAKLREAVPKLMELARDALDRDRYDTALRYASGAVRFARRTPDRELSKAAGELNREARVLGYQYDAVRQARDVIASDPDNATAHETIGRFYAFAKDNWPAALPHLARSDDDALAAAAAAEKDHDGDAGQLAKVADAWADAARREARLDQRHALLRHARDLYLDALQELSGLDAADARKALEEIRRQLPHAAPPGAVLAFAFDRKHVTRQGKHAYIRSLTGEHHARVVGDVDIERGHIGDALQLRGGHLRIANHKDLQFTGDLTIHMLLRPNAVGRGRQNPIYKSYGGEFATTLEPDGTLSMYCGAAGADAQPYNDAKTSEPLTNGKWAQLVIVRDMKSETVRAYLNGKRVTEKPVVHTPLKASANDLLIGDGYAEPFLGQIDELIIWPRALKDSELADLQRTANAGDSIAGQ